MPVPPSNTVVYAIRTNVSVFAEPSQRSQRLQYATDNKDEYRDWQTNDQIGQSTGNGVTNQEGSWVEVVVRQWEKQKLANNTAKALWFIPGINLAVAAVTNLATEWVRVDTTAYIKEADLHTGEQREANERAVIEKRVAEASGAIPKEYQPSAIFQNDAGVWSVKLPNGYVTTVEKYGAAILLERKNLALTIEKPPIVPTAKPETQAKKLPVWAIALMIAAGVSLVGIVVVQLTKNNKNSNTKKRQGR